MIADATEMPRGEGALKRKRHAAEGLGWVI